MSDLEEEAFYYVRLTEGDGWIVAQRESGQWWLCGSDVGFSAVAEIGPRLVMPLEPDV